MTNIKRKAMQERCRLERERLAELQLTGTRLEEDEAIRIFKDTPSVQAIARRMRTSAKSREAPKHSSFIERMRNWLTSLLE